MNDQVIELMFRCDTQQVAKATAAARSGEAATKDATAAAAAYGTAIDKAGGRARDASGRFASMGAAAREQAAAVQQAGRAATGAAAAFDQYARSSARARAPTTPAADGFYDMMGLGATSKPDAPGGPGRHPHRRIHGQDRAAAMSRLGMGTLNSLQDSIQGGSPAFAINNVMAMAGDNGIKALGAEAIAAAGGIGVIGAAFATVAVVAGAAFLTIDAGLKSAHLGWEDFGTVVANTTPVLAATSAIETLGHVAESTGLDVAATFVWDTLTASVRTIADMTLGWTGATEAAKKHRDEVAATTKAMKEAADAQKELATFRSDQQKDAEARGKLVGGAIADLGGDKGVEAVVASLAYQKAGMNGGEEVEQQYTDKDGVRQTRTVTRLQLAEEEARRELARAIADPAEAEKLAPRLKAAGYDPTALLDAAQGVDADADIAADQKESDRRRARTLAERKRRAEQAEREAERDRKATADALAKDLVPRALRGEEVTPDTVRRALEGSGSDSSPEAAEAIFAKISGDLREAIRKRALEKGLDTQGAWADLIKEQADRDEADRKKARAGLAGPGREEFAKVKEAAEAEELARQQRLRPRNQAASNGLMGRIADASGLADPIMNLMMQARASAMSDRKFQRSLRGMDFAEREQAIAGRNAQADEKIQAMTARELMRTGMTRDPNFAAGIAGMMVAGQRKGLDGMTGDQALDRNAEETAKLADQIGELNRNGVKFRQGLKK